MILVLVAGSWVLLFAYALLCSLHQLEWVLRFEEQMHVVLPICFSFVGVACVEYSGD